MTELVLCYILPNITLFGGLYGVAKYVEYAVWGLIVWSTESF